MDITSQPLEITSEPVGNTQLTLDEHVLDMSCDLLQVVEWCCQCIAHLGSLEPAQNALVAQGAVEKLLDAVSYFNKQDSAEHIRVQVQAIGAIASLVQNNSQIKLHMEQVTATGVHELRVSWVTTGRFR